MLATIAKLPHIFLLLYCSILVLFLHFSAHVFYAVTADSTQMVRHSPIYWRPGGF